MDTAIALLSQLLILAGALVSVIGTIGLLRFPDFYSRLHATSVTDSFGAVLLLSGMALHFGLTLGSVKVLMILFFLLFTSPTACHALVQTADKSGLKPWTAAPREAS